MSVRIGPTDQERRAFNIEPVCDLDDTDARCRVTKVTREGPAPVLQADAERLRRLAADSNQLRVALCPCGRGSDCLTQWTIDRPTKKYDLVTINPDYATTNYLLQNGNVEFKVRWSTTRDDRDLIDSEAVLTFSRGDWRRAPQFHCKD